MERIKIAMAEITQSTIAEFTDKLNSLQSALLTAHPEMPVLLQRIHRQLKEDPDLVTILTEEQIATIVNGISVVTNTKLAVDSKKVEKTAKDKRLKNVTLDDLDL